LKNPTIARCQKAARVRANQLRRKHPDREYKVKDDVWKRREQKVFAGCEILMSMERNWWGTRKWVQREYLEVAEFRKG